MRVITLPSGGAYIRVVITQPSGGALVLGGPHPAQLRGNQIRYDASTNTSEYLLQTGLDSMEGVFSHTRVA